MYEPTKMDPYFKNKMVIFIHEMKKPLICVDIVIIAPRNISYLSSFVLFQDFLLTIVMAEGTLLFLWLDGLKVWE